MSYEAERALKSIQEAAAALEYTALTIKKDFEESLNEIKRNFAAQNEISVRLLQFTDDIQRKLEYYDNLKDSKLIPANKYAEIIEMLNVVKLRVDGLSDIAKTTKTITKQSSDSSFSEQTIIRLIKEQNATLLDEVLEGIKMLDVPNPKSNVANNKYLIYGWFGVGLLTGIVVAYLM